jgi:micrococcal nuclease
MEQAVRTVLILLAQDRAMVRVIPFRQFQHHPVKRRRTVGNWRGFAPSGVTILNLSMLMFLAVLFWPNAVPTATDALPFAHASSADKEMAHFGYCHQGGGKNCVVDGDTFHYRGETIRIADIDTPETHPPNCPREAELGEAATRRLQALLNAGAFSLEPIDRDTDRYGRKLRVVTRGEQSLGEQLVSEGLARYYEGGRQPWC